MTERSITIKKHSICYADPPWRYSQGGLQGAAEKHYPTMGIEELCALPVADLMAEDSALFMWATFPQFPEALRLIKAWGFNYKSVAFVWLKKNKKADSWFYGLGFWTRGNAEVCLLATRGHPKRQAANVHQFIISPLEEHSKKPDEAREKIVALMGDLPRAELFARQTPPGWDVWGNEVTPTIPDFGPNWSPPLGPILPVHAAGAAVQSLYPQLLSAGAMVHILFPVISKSVPLKRYFRPVSCGLGPHVERD